MVPNMAPTNFIRAIFGIHSDGIRPDSAGFKRGGTGVRGILGIFGQERPESSNQIDPNNTNRAEPAQNAPNSSQNPSKSPSKYKAEYRRIRRIGQKIAPTHPYIPPGKSCFFHSVLIRVQILPKSNDFVANSGKSVAFSAYSARFGSTFGSLFGCNRGIRAILVTFGSILDSIRIAIRLYSGCPKSIRVNSWRFCLIRNLFGTYSSLIRGAPRIRDE